MRTCPGQDSRFWKPEDIFDIACGRCGHQVEFFKDDGTRRCPQCGSRMVNPRISIGCARWCKQAKECLGYDPTEQDDECGEVALTDLLIAAIKEQFGDDQRRITHALQVLEYANAILRTEDADPRVVFAAAILHDIGIQEAERLHGSAAGKYQEMEGPPIARRIMYDIGMDAETIEHVCQIVGSHHSAGVIDTQEFRILWDADWLVNTPDECADCSADQITGLIARVFRTGTGKQMATRLFLDGEATEGKGN